MGNVNPAGEPPTTAAGMTMDLEVAPPAPKRRRATGTVSLEFLPGEGRKLITLLHTFILFIQSIGPVNFCMHNDRSWCRFRCRWSCLCWFRSGRAACVGSDAGGAACVAEEQKAKSSVHVHAAR